MRSRREGGRHVSVPVAERLALHWRILLAMVAALVLAALLPAHMAIGGIPLEEWCRLGGSLFINALKMLVIPLIASSLVVAVMSIGGGRDFGRLFGRLVMWVVITSLIATLIGLAMVNLVQPGAGTHIVPPSSASPISPVATSGAQDVLHTLLAIVPANPLAAAVNDQLVGVVFFSVLFGVFAVQLPKTQAQVVSTLAQAVFGTMIGMARWVLRFAPAGVFLLLLNALLIYGFGMLLQLGAYIVTVLAGLLVHALVVLPLVVFLFAKRSPRWLFQAVAPAVMTAFSTASSKAALPLTMDALENKAGVPERISRFALPLSATLNMNGSALYECVAAIFIAQLYGIPLGFSGQLVVVLVSLLTTLGLSGMPGAGVIGLTTVLAAAGLPADGLALVLAVDRLLDMSRTAVNVWGDACVTTVIAKTESSRSG